MKHASRYFACMASIPPFTRHRLTRFVEQFRSTQGQLPTRGDFERAGFDSSLVKQAVRENILSEFYVTLTNGAVVKGYRVKNR